MGPGAAPAGLADELLGSCALLYFAVQDERQSTKVLVRRYGGSDMSDPLQQRYSSE